MSGEGPSAARHTAPKRGMATCGAPTRKSARQARTAALSSAPAGGAGKVKRAAASPGSWTETSAVEPFAPMAPPACRYTSSPSILRHPVIA